MKKLTIVLAGLLISSAAYAQTGEQMKAAAIAACGMQVENVADDQKDMVRKTCECTVENTDYDKVLKASQSGNFESVQADALKVAQDCAKESGAS